MVARERGTICFVEVRTRRGEDKHEEALGSVDQRKQYQLSKLAIAFLQHNDLLGKKARFDVISVCFAGSRARILLIKNAFPVADKYNG